MYCSPFLEMISKKLSLFKLKKRRSLKDPFNTDDFDMLLPLTNISSEQNKDEDKTRSDLTKFLSWAVINSMKAIAKDRKG